MPDSGDFRLGVQKCKKTIKDTVRDPHVFDFENNRACPGIEQQIKVNFQKSCLSSLF